MLLITRNYELKKAGDFECLLRDGALDLHSIIDFEGIPEELKKLVQNFRVHVVEVRKLKDTSMFRTDVRQVFDIIRYSEEPEKIQGICEAAVAHAPEFECDKVYQAWKTK